MLPLYSHPPPLPSPGPHTAPNSWQPLICFPSLLRTLSTVSHCLEKKVHRPHLWHSRPLGCDLELLFSPFLPSTPITHYSSYTGQFTVLGTCFALSSLCIFAHVVSMSNLLSLLIHSEEPSLRFSINIIFTKSCFLISTIPKQLFSLISVIPLL